MKNNIQPLTYQYSKINSSLCTALLIGFAGWSVPYLFKYVRAKDIEACMLIGLVDLAFIVMAVIVIINYTLPAIQGRTALELNNEELISYMRNVSIPWGDIEDIDLRTGKSASALYIKLKVETDHGSQIRIPLMFVSGRDEDIYEAVKAFKV